MSETSSFERVFTEDELRLGAKRSVEALCEAVDQADFAAAATYSKRLRYEVLSMQGNYDGWLVTLLAWIKRHDGAAAAEGAEQKLPSAHEDEGLAASAQTWRETARLIAAAIASSDGARAKELARTLHGEALAYHDRGMTKVMTLLSQIGRAYGTDSLEEALGEAMASDMLGDQSFKQRAEALMHFTRVHLQPFEVTEDAEKLTFLCPVCPSGGRLLREGHYDGPDGGLFVEGPRPFTYGRDQLPVYCCHEPVMEKASIEATGVPMFIVEPSEQLGVLPCKTYLYKDAADIPERYYTRLGLTKPKQSKA